MATIFHCLTILALPLKSIPKVIMPSLLAPPVASTEPADIAECVVCLSEIREGEERSEELRCKHVFHKCCLDRWVEHQRRTCPLCRDQLLSHIEKKKKSKAEAEVRRMEGERTILFSPFSGFNVEDNWWIR